MQKDGQRESERGEITACHPGLKQISAVQVSTFEVKVSLKWVFRHPQIKPTDSSDLYKLLSAAAEREGGEEMEPTWLKLLLIETFQLFFGVEGNSRGREMKRGVGSVLTCSFSARPPTHHHTSNFCVYVQIQVARKCGSGREGVIWSSCFFLPPPRTAQLNLMTRELVQIV